MNKILKSIWDNIRIPVYCSLALLALIGGFKLVANLGLFTADQESSDSDLTSAFKKIDWRTLRQLDYKTGKSTDTLKDLDGKPVMIPGFIVPLEDNQIEISEFLFVPSPQACIHVPPPPPNQMIFVKMKAPIQFQWGYRAFWVSGTLKLSTVESPYGAVSFEMLGDNLKAYRPLD